MHTLVYQSAHSSRTVYFLATGAIWIMSMFAAIAGGVYFYDARLNEQLRIVAFLVPSPPPPPPPLKGGVQATANSRYVQAALPNHTFPTKLSDVRRVNSLPPSIGVGDPDGDPAGEPGGVIGGLIGGVHNATGELPRELPPPPKVERDHVDLPLPSIVRRHESVLRGNAVTRKIPEYPVLARNAGIYGDVQVEIVIDENGNVVSASVLSGPQLLHSTSLQAAKQWKFRPTLLNGTPVKVQGLLTFRFTL